MGQLDSAYCSRSVTPSDGFLNWATSLIFCSSLIVPRHLCCVSISGAVISLQIEETYFLLISTRRSEKYHCLENMYSFFISQRNRWGHFEYFLTRKVYFTDLQRSSNKSIHSIPDIPLPRYLYSPPSPLYRHHNSEDHKVSITIQVRDTAIWWKTEKGENRRRREGLDSKKR